MLARQEQLILLILISAFDWTIPFSADNVTVGHLVSLDERAKRGCADGTRPRDVGEEFYLHQMSSRPDEAGARKARVAKGCKETSEIQKLIQHRSGIEVPASRTCDSASSSSCSGGCSGSGRLSCTQVDSCNPSGANSPSGRQKSMLLAQDAAKDAKCASEAQRPAALQAAHQVKMQLAEKACQASNAAQAALAGKRALVEALQDQITEAESVLQEHLVALCHLQDVVELSTQLLCEAQNQVTTIETAFQNTKSYAEHSDILYRTMERILEEKEALMACARKQIEQLLCQLNFARQDLDATCRAAQDAASAAQQAQTNADRNRRNCPSADLLAVTDRHEYYNTEDKIAPRYFEIYETFDMEPVASYVSSRCGTSGHRTLGCDELKRAVASRGNSSIVPRYRTPKRGATSCEVPGYGTFSCGPTRCVTSRRGAMCGSQCGSICGSMSESRCGSRSGSMSGSRCGSRCGSRSGSMCGSRCASMIGQRMEASSCGASRGKSNCELPGAHSAACRQKATESAQNAAEEAQAMTEAQQAAALQASHQVRAQLAEKACQASNSAQEALAGKQAIVDQLEEHIKDAEAVLSDEGCNMCLVQTTVDLTKQEACRALEEQQIMDGALKTAQASAETVGEIVRNAEQLRDDKQQLIEELQRQIEEMLRKLTEAQQNLKCTCTAAKQAAACAEEAHEYAMRCRRKIAMSNR